MSTRFASWLKNLQRWFANPASAVKRVPNRKMSRLAALAVEQLEDRLVPAIFTVNSLADLSIQGGVNDVNGAILGHGNTVTLRSAVEAADMTPGGNTIRLAVPGTYSIALPGANTGADATGAFAILPTGGNLSIINVSGGAITVNGNHLDRVFDINPNFNFAAPTPAFTVTLQGFTIANGVASPGDGAAGSGGGIRDQGNASLMLTNMVVTNNSASADGGGVSMENIVSEPWKLTVNNSVISNNHAGDAGGGLETDGTGKILINAGTVITGNTCVNQGAGIWLDAIANTVGSVTVSAGGTGFVKPPSVTFTSIDGQGSGAAGFTTINNSGAVTSVVVTNPGSGYDAPPALSFANVFGGGLGSGVVAAAHLLEQGATLTVTGAVISNNQALTGPGGGIGNAGSGAVTIISSTIENNTSGMAGGGFADQNNAGTLVVANSLFLNNVAGADGGAIQEGGPTTSITNSQITGNSSGATGGGIFASGITLFVQNSTIANNIAAGNANTSQGGGGIELETSGTGLNASTITNTTISGNKALNNATVLGGGIDVRDTTVLGDLVLLNDTINANYAGEGGGLFWAGAGTFTVQNTIIAGNVSPDGVDAFINPQSAGFGPFIDNGGNLIGVGGDDNIGFTSGTTQTGTLANPLNPLLAPLGNYGGPTIGAPGATQVLQTEALQTGSTAIGNGTLFRAPAYDERGVMHLLNNTINVGAVSAVVAPPPAPVTKINLSVPLVSQRMVSGVETTTYYVNSTSDTHTPTAGTLTLRAAIDMANQVPGNKIIELIVPGDYKITLPGANTGTNASGAFAILPSGGNVTIVNGSGGAATVDGNHLDRVFDINPADDTNFNDEFTVTLQGITITNGIAQSGDGAAGSGGGIRDQGIASLTLNNVALTNNLATADGGGLSMENAASSHWVLTINDSVISYNHAGDAGGGVETDGSSKVAVNAGTVITGNTAVNQGAGVWLDAITAGTTGTVASVTIINAGVHGYIGPRFTVTFTSADGKGSGAQGVPVVNAGGMITGVTITNAGSGYDMPPTVSFNYALFSPDITAVATLTPLQESAALYVTGTLISNNDSLDMLGGGIGNAGNGAVAIANSTIENNFSAGTGGGFADANNQGSLTVTNSLFLANVAVGAGGGIQEGGPSTVITNTEIAGNVSGNAGGGIFANGATLQITSSTIANNTASGDGNGLGGGGIELQTTGTSSITNTTITNNRAVNNAGANGGAIDATNLVGSLALLNDTINANSATNGGGGFWGGLTGSTFGLENTILAQNFLLGGAGVDADNLASAFTDLGGNLIGVAGDANTGFTAHTTQAGTLADPFDPLLGPLGYYGGPAVGSPGNTLFLQTEAPLLGSKAIGKGIKTGAPLTDERGAANGTVIVIGATN